MRYGFGLSAEVALKASQGIRIVHVHGSFGELPPNESGREFGAGPAGFVEASENLHIVSDDIESSGVLSKCAAMLDQAKRVVFLGFGYDKINLDRLNLFENGRGHEYFGTVYGMTQSEVASGPEHYFRDRGLGLNAARDNVDCLRFLREYRHAFA